LYIKNTNRLQSNRFKQIVLAIFKKLNENIIWVDDDQAAFELNKLLDERKIQRLPEHEYNPLLRVVLDKNILYQIELADIKVPDFQ
jgi:hypothetical protein